MQIFPNDPQATGFESLFGTSNKSSYNDTFAEFLKLAQKSTQNAEDYTPSDPLDEAPYSANANNSSGLFSLDEVNFTKSELFELHQSLLKAGAQSQDLDKLRTLIDKPDGATISQILKSLNPEDKIVELSESEQLSLSSLLTKIDSTGELENSVNALLENGHGLSAWSIISQKLSSVDQSGEINISKDEIATLGKALGLSGKSQEQLLSGFGSFDSMSLNPASLQKLLSPAQTDLVENDLNKGKLQNALEATLGPILQKANDRFQDAKDAASLRSKTAQHTDILIQDVVTKDVRSNLEQAATGGTDASKQNDTDKNAQTIKGDSKQNQNAQATTVENAKAISNDKGPVVVTDNATANDKAQAQATANAQATTNTQAQSNAQATANAAANATAQNGQNTTVENPLVASQAAANSNQEVATTLKNDANNANIAVANNAKDMTSEHDADNNSNNNSNNQSNNKDPNWDSLLGKVEVQPSSTKSETSFSSITGVQNSSNAPVAENVNHDMTKSTPAPRSSDSNISSQVEKALLSAMKNGSTRLELQLNPGDLGNITLILTSSRGGEVSASIRSDRTETAEVMQRQLDIIRVNLEQQGIKIDKLEVQYESPEKQQDNTWKDFQQHNSQQEQNARQEQLTRLRNLRSVRNSGTNPQSNTLEQNMHIPSTTANSSTTSLHVVA